MPDDDQKNGQDDDERKSPAHRKAAWWKSDVSTAFTIVVTFLVGVLAAGSAILSGILSANATVEAATAREQIATQNARDDARREQSLKVYSAYLDAANDYALRNGEMTTELERIRPFPENERVPNPQIFGTWMTARANYQGATNNVFVYGSDEAWQIHGMVAGSLPPAIGSNIQFGPTDEANFRSAYQAFLSMMCREGNASPRPGCGN